MHAVSTRLKTLVGFSSMYRTTCINSKSMSYKNFLRSYLLQSHAKRSSHVTCTHDVHEDNRKNKSNESLVMGSLAAAFAMVAFAYREKCRCEAMSSSFSKRLLDIAYSGTDHYGSISEEEEDAVNSTGGHWAYGEISFEGLEALMRRMDVGQGSVFYDFGSGLGKVTAQSFLTTEAERVVGIEMAVTRHTQAWQACERLGKLLELVTDIGGAGEKNICTSSRCSSAAAGCSIGGREGEGMASWFEEAPAQEPAMAPAFVLRGRDGRELRLLHSDCLRAPASDATHIYMANLTWPEPVIARLAARLAALPALRRVASLRPLDGKAMAEARLREDGVMVVAMSWQDRNRDSYGVPVYLYARSALPPSLPPHIPLPR